METFDPPRFRILRPALRVVVLLTFLATISPALQEGGGALLGQNESSKRPAFATAAAPFSPIHLQEQPSKELMVGHWERHKENVLEYVAAMPQGHFEFRPTEGVRTFAEQIEHIVEDHVGIVSTVFDRDDSPDLGDPESYLTDKDALLAHVETGYGYVLRILQEADEDELWEEGEVFGRYRVSRWHALSGALEHGTWTLGQVVPYLRLNEVEPPAYTVFPLDTQVEGWEPPPGRR